MSFVEKMKMGEVSVSEMMRLREEYGMTNKEIAENLGIHYNTVLRYIGKQRERKEIVMKKDIRMVKSFAEAKEEMNKQESVTAEFKSEPAVQQKHHMPFTMSQTINLVSKDGKMNVDVITDSDGNKSIKVKSPDIVANMDYQEMSRLRFMLAHVNDMLLAIGEKR